MDADLMSDRTLHRYMTMKGIHAQLKDTGYIWTDPERCDGRPCLKGHRFTLHQLFEELAIVYTADLKALSETYKIDFNLLKGALIEVAQLFDKPSPKPPEKPDEDAPCMMGKPGNGKD